MVRRKQFQINGRVQGVGFRPCVYQTATKLKLSGWVRNDASGVTLEIQGEAVEKFWQTLLNTLPPLAKIDTYQEIDIEPKADENEFLILQSQEGKLSALISPDVVICKNCLQELFDQKSRFYLYPFLNCTQCGPRLTITSQLPYDRHNTSMADFLFCEQCQQDYTNPNNRRYHAQPTACQRCGPKLSVSLKKIAQSIQRGEIVALKGLGGYQLVCDARNEITIMKLRQRKRRSHKPFALMTLNEKSATLFSDFNEEESSLLNSIERPIVFLKKKLNTLPEIIAPDLSHIGIMLPSTPLHYLLFHALLGFPENDTWLEESHSIVLIVTSGNQYNKPIAMDDITVQEELNEIADRIVSYNRYIVTRMDDSVVRTINHAPCFIRRARGYVPIPIKLLHAVPSILALGCDLKNTFCITRGDQAFLSQHIGDLKNKENRDFFHEAIQYHLKFLGIKPERVIHDMHPDFYSTQYARQFDIPTISVQHHHAHLASVMAEYQLQQPALGLALDGFGYGSDGQMWGGELMLIHHEKAERLSHLQSLLLPGGDQAARYPWTMGASVLYELGRSEEIYQRFSQYANVDFLMQMLEKKINTPTSSSCGRLFDAAAALLNIHTTIQYEGQAAMKLESFVTTPEVMPGGWKILAQGLTLLPLFSELLHVDAVRGANLFHGTLIAALADLVMHWARIKRVEIVLMSGGCFLNKILTEGLIKALTAENLIVLFPKQVPPNDAGIALGQAWIGGLTCV